MRRVKGVAGVVDQLTGRADVILAGNAGKFTPTNVIYQPIRSKYRVGHTRHAVLHVGGGGYVEWFGDIFAKGDTRLHSVIYQLSVVCGDGYMGIWVCR